MTLAEKGELVVRMANVLKATLWQDARALVVKTTKALGGEDQMRDFLIFLFVRSLPSQTCIVITY